MTRTARSRATSRGLARSGDRSLARAGAIIRAHYGLARAVTPAEVRAEIANLRRKAGIGLLDDSQSRLYYRLHLDVGISPLARARA